MDSRILTNPEAIRAIKAVPSLNPCSFHSAPSTPVYSSPSPHGVSLVRSYTYSDSRSTPSQFYQNSKRCATNPLVTTTPVRSPGSIPFWSTPGTDGTISYTDNPKDRSLVSQRISRCHSSSSVGPIRDAWVPGWGTPQSLPRFTHRQSPPSSLPSDPFIGAGMVCTDFPTPASLSPLAHRVQRHRPYTTQSPLAYRVGSHPRMGSKHYLPTSYSAHKDLLSPKSESEHLEKPKETYSMLIARAILSTPGYMARLSTIYRWISDHYPYFRTKESLGWQNSIRHNLSLNKSFIRIPADQPAQSTGKGDYWTISAMYFDKFQHLLEECTVRQFSPGMYLPMVHDWTPPVHYPPSLSPYSMDSCYSLGSPSPSTVSLPGLLPCYRNISTPRRKPSAQRMATKAVEPQHLAVETIVSSMSPTRSNPLVELTPITPSPIGRLESWTKADYITKPPPVMPPLRKRSASYHVDDGDPPLAKRSKPLSEAPAKVEADVIASGELSPAQVKMSLSGASSKSILNITNLLN
ncbi:transcription factor [Dispira parvispora]|uniref:Transcription factor n=1 Tax=Dispira parvispora TaxID=1520584 RepID=A0A9W8ARS2_9FUNG|nr:transcription factor [Dispira parvispora]